MAAPKDGRWFQVFMTDTLAPWLDKGRPWIRD